MPHHRTLNRITIVFTIKLQRLGSKYFFTTCWSCTGSSFTKLAGLPIGPPNKQWVWYFNRVGAMEMIHPSKELVSQSKSIIQNTKHKVKHCLVRITSKISKNTPFPFEKIKR
eukprot:TRINITY_DN8024_c0_g1_i3.p1 TRINITY_DN8024_c0_g1~~TRINITY_DN8024_c0_g1_i3.p1  ORF type:complete len:112 (-),score=8.10 TRINITY_DN8024_c0_g1_i3:2535-2870(-)